jgi:hypothetical protein
MTLSIKPNIHAENEFAFINACGNGHLNIVSWLYGLDDNPNIHANNDEAFSFACIDGHINIVQWLYGLDDKPNIHANNDEAFRFACEKGHINIVQWLYGLDDKPNIHANNDYAFRWSCKNGHINIAQWLYELDDKTNIRNFDDYVFRYACINNNIDIAKWLVIIEDNYSIEIKNNSIINCKIRNGINELFNKKEYMKIVENLCIKKVNFEIEKDNKCCICFSENYNFMSSCNHYFCFECFFTWFFINRNNIKCKKCCYCNQDIFFHNCAVKI